LKYRLCCARVPVVQIGHGPSQTGYIEFYLRSITSGVYAVIIYAVFETVFASCIRVASQNKQAQACSWRAYFRPARLMYSYPTILLLSWPLVHPLNSLTGGPSLILLFFVKSSDV
jgi:hypothetical protein